LSFYLSGAENNWENKMSRRFSYPFLALLLIAVFILPGCSSSVSPSPTAFRVKIRYADQNSATGWEGSHAAQPWLDQITAATNNAVTFETYYSQSLFKGTDAWTSTKYGVADVAMMVHGYWAYQTPLADVMTLPLLPFKSAKQASGIIWQLYEKYPSLQDEFKDNHVLVTYASDPYILITNKKQVKTLEDIRGMQIRVTAGPPVNMIRLLGATPVTKSMPDSYLALQKGEIDGMAVSWEAILSFRLYEVVKYYTYMPLFSVYLSQAMNNERWDSLPQYIRDQIKSVGGLKGSLFWGENQFDTAAAEGRSIVKKQGLEMVEYTMPDEELARWRAVAGQPLWDAWVKKMTEKGLPEAKEILQTTQKMIETYSP
jgi:TRAP-type transport system periplasmic protein